MTFRVCLRCAIKLNLTVRDLISHSYRPFAAPTLCWCP